MGSGEIGVFLSARYDAPKSAPHQKSSAQTRSRANHPPERRPPMLHLINTLPALSLTVTKPSPSLAPIEVVNAQLEALSAGDVQRCFEFASPANKQQTGPWQKFEMMVRQTPAYAPLVSCSSFEVTSALSLTADRYQARVAIKPAGSSSAPFAVAEVQKLYTWMLSQQSEGEFEGCWMVDGVMPTAPTRED